MHFPNFTDKETRLYELDELEHMIENTPNMNLKSIQFFEYKRSSTLARLEEQAKGYHYSTFRLFSKKESPRSDMNYMPMGELTLWRISFLY
jgi:hypothetical protein